MGLNIGANALTSGGLYVTTILLVIMGILLISASNKVKGIDDFEDSDKLKKLHDNLRTAYILTFIAAGILFLVGSAYAGHESVWCLSEWWHGLFGLITLVLFVIAVIVAYVALNDLYTPEIENRNGSDLFIWGSLVVAIFAFLGMGIVTSGRVGYHAVGTDTSDRLYTAEKKLHEAHSAVTGQAMEYKERPKFCGEDPCQDKNKSMAAPVHKMVSQPVFSQQGLQQGGEQPLGPPIVTRHSVVTTSQPMLSTPANGNGILSQQNLATTSTEELI
jgi:hypothetical protein